MLVHRKMRVGVVGGGGPENFFGAPHRTAILMDNQAELTAGALRSSPEGSLECARELFFERGYPDYQTMLGAEAALPESQRIDYVTIITPNDTHYPVAKAALTAGFPVLCEKPLALSLPEALELVRLSHGKGLPFGVAYTYTGLPMVMLAREMVQAGDIGDVRKVETWYRQGSLASRVEDSGSARMAWRTDPKRAGASGCGGDIGTHGYEFMRFSTGLVASKVQARLSTFVEGRRLDDDFTVLARLSNGGTATITASQVTIGARNENGFRIVGTKGSLEWSMEDHTALRVAFASGPVRVYRLGRGLDHFPASIQPYLRLPAGHPEGFHEALANLHRSLQWRIRAQRGESVPPPYPHPDAAAGAAGIAFVMAAVESSANGGAWTDVPEV